jgi:hypothetical protein
MMLPTVYSTSDRRELDEDLESVLGVMTKLVSYVVEGRRYLAFQNYPQWQKIDRPSPSNLPPPPTNEPQFDDDSTNDRRALVPNRIERNGIEHISSSGDDGFESFWSAYPRKVAKQDALKAWRKIKAPPDVQDEILNALERRKESPEWQKDNGQFIPHAATWLNGKRWEDVVTVASRDVDPLSLPYNHPLRSAATGKAAIG